MAHSKGYRQYVFDTINALNRRAEELQKELTQKQLAQEDILHYIEFGSVDAVGRTKLFNALKKVRLERREIKEECERMQSAKSRLSAVLSRPTPTRTYVPRVVNLESIVGKPSKRG